MKAMPIYLDYAASTPIDPKVIAAMLECMQQPYAHGNAHALHHYGQTAYKAIEEARKQVAQLLGAATANIIFTSGATEANNLAILGAARFNATKGKHIVTTKIEHPSVLRACKQLESEGFEVTYLMPNRDGIVTSQSIEQALRSDTILVSQMLVNNETGVIQDCARVGALTRARHIVFHIDAVQAAGKIPIDVDALGADLLSLSAHKIYGPKGVGALYINRNRRIRLKPILVGGEQENGMRAGTLATHQIVGMGYAAKLAQLLLTEESLRISKWNDLLSQGLAQLNDIFINGAQAERVPGILNISVKDVAGEMLIKALNQLALSTSSTCHSAKQTPSAVLTAMDVPEELINSSLRLSFGRFTTEQEIIDTISILRREILNLREHICPS